VAFTTHSIYKRVLQIGILMQISVTHPKYRQLEAKDIIQINATVIAVALILLTLLHSTPESGSSLGLGSIMAALSHMSVDQMIASMTGTIVIIFAFSAIAVSIFSYIVIGRRLMVARFVYLFFRILALTYF
jgi:preprotein translocase subunit SecG